MTVREARDAASSIADALLEVATRSRSHRRLFLRDHLGVTPKSVFDRLEPLLREEVIFESVPGVRLAAARVGGVLLIPYLVQEQQGTGNRGLRGFAGTLRTEFTSGAAGDVPRVLLILDERPFETVLSAAEDASTLPALGWANLLRRLTSGPRRPETDLLALIADDLTLVPESSRSLDLLNEVGQFADRSFADAAEAGLHLATISVYLNDAAPTVDRLRQSRQWRSELAAWSLPDKDLAIELARYAGAPTAGIAKVIAAKGVTGLDWTLFTLEDLPPRKSRASAHMTRPPAIVGSTGHIANESAAVIRLSEDAEALGIRFTGTAAGIRPTIRWGTEAATAASVNEAALLLEFSVPGRGTSGWYMGRLDWRRGDALNLAIYRGDGAWFPAEAGLLIDPLSGSFVVEEPVNVLAVDGRGAVVGDAEVLDELGGLDPGEVVQVGVAFAGSRHVIPLQVMDVIEEPEPRDPDEPVDPEDPSDPDQPDPEPPVDEDTAKGVARSGAHALLDYAARRMRQGLTVSERSLRFAAGTEPTVSGDGAFYVLESQTLDDGRDGLDGIALEQQIIDQASVLAFTVVRDGPTPRLKPDTTLERLNLDALDPVATKEFLEARASYFAAIANRQAHSVHATLCGVGQNEARAYVDTYDKLLCSIPVPGAYEAEYDRLLLLDLVSDPSTGQCWIAPTNPVTVAWALEMAKTAASWAQDGAQLPSRDLAALSPTFLLPLFHASGSWWEIDPRSPLLWRRYRPVGSSLALGGGDHKTITRRIEKFLAVFPVYADRSQKLSIAMHEPGDGGSTADALRSFYAAERQPGAESARPHLDVTIYSESGELPPALAELVAPDNDEEIDRLVRSRITLASLVTSDKPAFAHMSFVFRAPAAREPRPVRLSERCPTDWVDALAAAPGRTARFGANEMSFASGLFVDSRQCNLSRLIERTLELVGGQPRGFLQRGLTQVTTTTVDVSAMDPVYASSVWTTHADRLLGPEAFSKSSMTIVDFDDRSTYWQAGLDSITVTARVEPYRMALTRAFAPAADLQKQALGGLIGLGNAVSGRWNLDLLSLSLNGVRERIGILAAIAALRDLDLAFTTSRADTGDLGGVLLPVDELFRLLPASGLTRPRTRSCDDLMYLRVRDEQGGRVRLNGRLLEVKYTSVGQPDLGIARRELEATRAWLDGAFNVRTPSRRFRSRDLAEFIRSGAIRNRSFGLEGIDLDDLERVAAAVSHGDYDLTMSYEVAGETLAGDVVSLELENPVLARRQALPGEGVSMGYVRLGAPAFQRLANTGSLPRPADWLNVSFPAQPGDTPRSGGSPVDRPSPVPGGTTALASGVTEQPESRPTTGQSSSSVDVIESDRGLEDEVASKAHELDGAATKYGIQLAPFETSLAQVGPSVIRFRTKLLGRQTIASVRAKAMDLGREVGVAEGLLVDQEPYYVTVDVPRRERVVVRLSDHLSALGTSDAPGALPFLLGMAPSGEIRVEDLARLPHLLVAGATGSGKSVLLRGLLCCLAQVRSPMQLQILIIDPKQVDFMPFESLLHLVDQRVITDPVEAIAVLGRTLEHEVSWRRNKLKEAGATSALEFYERGGAVEELPQMVILVDEFADLAASLDRKDREAFMTLIQRYGQLTRAFGIYLVLATQRPSVQVITGDIKANLTARVALKVQSSVDSTTILGRGGAEALRDRGDLLFDHGGVTERLQGFLATLDDVRSVTERWVSRDR